VSQSQTGVATGMNTNIRNIGGAVGAGVATSVVVSSLLRDGIPAEHGYILAFVISALAMLVAAGAALLIPHHAAEPETEPSVDPEVAVDVDVAVPAPLVIVD
jgi:nitrate/nitrite transporter NarK